jgi:hypothetical protein
MLHTQTVQYFISAACFGTTMPNPGSSYPVIKPAKTRQITFVCLYI